MRRLRISIHFVALLISLTAIASCNPLKVTDPSDPRFNPDKFRFVDYRSREEKIDAFRNLFPVGTSKEFVDRVLVSSGGSKSSEIKEFPQVWRYLEPAHPGLPNGPVHIFIFTDEDKVENVYFAANEYLYPDRLTYTDIKNSKAQ